jgi:hypothetical protein
MEVVHPGAFGHRAVDAADTRGFEMSAISDDTAALVAGQLTQAWATLLAQNPGAGGFNPNDLKAKLAEVYMQFRDAVTEVDVTHRPSPDVQP